MYAPMMIRATSMGFSLAVASAWVAVAAAAEDPPACLVADTTSPAANAEFYGAASGGAPIATFTGVALPVRLSSFPATGSLLRLRVETGDGKKPSVRVAGYTPTTAFRYFAKVNVPIVPGHVWLTKGLELRLLGQKSGELEFEHAVLGTQASDTGGLKLRGSIPCAMVALAPSTVDAAEAPRGARWYHMRSEALHLYDSVRGQVVLELKMEPQVRKVFWSTETRADWVHVMAPGDITIDGWVRQTELEGLIHGEVFDMNSLEPVPLRSPTLALAVTPKTLTATSELVIASKAEAAAPPLGAVEVGATFFAMDVSTLWTSIVPTGLAIMPVDGAGFWVKTSSLPTP